MNTKELRNLYKFESLKVSDELKMNLFILLLCGGRILLLTS